MLFISLTLHKINSLHLHYHTSYNKIKTLVLKLLQGKYKTALVSKAIFFILFLNRKASLSLQASRYLKASENLVHSNSGLFGLLSFRYSVNSSYLENLPGEVCTSRIKEQKSHTILKAFQLQFSYKQWLMQNTQHVNENRNMPGQDHLLPSQLCVLQ